jgi:hypothetical protein
MDEADSISISTFRWFRRVCVKVSAENAHSEGINFSGVSNKRITAGLSIYTRGRVPENMQVINDFLPQLVVSYTLSGLLEIQKSPSEFLE